MQGGSSPFGGCVLRRRSAESGTGRGAVLVVERTVRSYAAHSHAYDKVIYVVSGSIAFGLPERADDRTATGDSLDLPAGTVHDAHVGGQGVICLEAHRTNEQAPSCEAWRSYVRAMRRPLRTTSRAAAWP